MSRSNPPRSSIVERLQRKIAPRRDSAAAHGRPLRRRLAIRLAALMRWLHIYLSMFGLAAVLFFSVTGLTLNHPDWFFGEAERRVQAEGRMDPSWLHLDAPAARPRAESDPSRQVAKLEVVEHLRKAHGDPRGRWPSSGSTSCECLVTFKGPGYAADAFIDRATGRYDLTADVPRLHRRHQRPAQGPRHRPGLVGGHRRLGRAHDGDLADGPGPAVLPEAPAPPRPGRGPGRHGRRRRGRPALGPLNTPRGVR